MRTGSAGLRLGLAVALMAMLAWYIGVQTGFTRGPGKYGKYLRRELEPELWAMLFQTYADADQERYLLERSADWLDEYPR